MDSPNDFMSACVSLLSMPRKQAGHADMKVSKTSEVVDYVAAGFGTASAALDAKDPPEEGPSMSSSCSTRKLQTPSPWTPFTHRTPRRPNSGASRGMRRLRARWRAQTLLMRWG